MANQLTGLVERRQEYEKDMEELKKSRHRIMLVHEQTRKEVAGLLHGRVQSRLVVLGHWLKECRQQLKDGPQEAIETLEKASNLLHEIRDQELRNITRQLYPSIMRTGLPSALNSLADRFRTMFDVEMEIDQAIVELESPVKLNPKLNESLRLNLYRVAEEALSNAAKHSRAKEAKVSLSLTPSEKLLLVIKDNGLGFEPSGGSQGQGLHSMEDYVTALGGHIEIHSAVGAGTMVVASVPMSNAQSPTEIVDSHV